MLALIPWRLQAGQHDGPDTLLVRYRQMALEYSDDLKASEGNVMAGIELEKAAKAGRLPSVSADGLFSYMLNPLEITRDFPGLGTLSFHGTGMKYGASVSLLQPVYTGGMIQESVRQAQSRLKISEYSMDALRTQVCYQVDIYYWNTVARQELVRVAEDFRNSVADLVRIVRDRVEAGMTDSQELLTAEVKLNEAEYQLLKARSEFETGLMAFNSLIGVPLDSATEIAGMLDTAEYFPADPDGYMERPELKMAEEEVRLEMSRMRMAESAYQPRLYVGAEGTMMSPGYDFTPGLSPNLSVYAKVSVPIFEGGKKRREKRAAEYSVKAADDRRAGVETRAELELRKAQVALEQSLEQVTLSEASLHKAVENERRATEKYEEGLLSVSDVIDAQVYRLNVQTVHVAAKMSALSCQADLMRASDSYPF